MKYFGLYGPRSKTFGFDLVLNCNRHILMPRYFPVCIWDFVEEDTSDWKELRSQNRFDQLADSG